MMSLRGLAPADQTGLHRNELEMGFVAKAPLGSEHEAALVDAEAPANSRRRGWWRDRCEHRRRRMEPVLDQALQDVRVMDFLGCLKRWSFRPEAHQLLLVGIDQCLQFSRHLGSLDQLA